MQKENPYSNWNTPDDFLKKQLWFFENTLQRYVSKGFSDDTIQINDIGVIDVILHTRIFPLANGYSWNVYPDFYDFIIYKYLDLPLANLTFYLHAPEAVIRNRRENDLTRVRRAFESNRKLYPYQKEFYFSLQSEFPQQVCCLDARGEVAELKRKVLLKLKRCPETPPLSLRCLLQSVNSFWN